MFYFQNHLQLQLPQLCQLVSTTISDRKRAGLALTMARLLTTLHKRLLFSFRHWTALIPQIAIPLLMILFGVVGWKLLKPSNARATATLTLIPSVRTVLPASSFLFNQQEQTAFSSNLQAVLAKYSALGQVNR